MVSLASPPPCRKLSHPKLVQFYGVCLNPAPICLVFEFMENGCLSDYLRYQRGMLTAGALLDMCLDVCEGMAYLEVKRVIHRDLVRPLVPPTAGRDTWWGWGGGRRKPSKVEHLRTHVSKCRYDAVLLELQSLPLPVKLLLCGDIPSDDQELLLIVLQDHMR